MDRDKPSQPAAGRLSVRASVVIGLATAAAFWSWIGWDRHRTPGADGGLQGPLEPWQVQCCVGTLLVIGVLAGLARRGAELVIALTVSVALSWTVWAVWSSGGTGGGLVGVGLVMVAIGTGAAAGAVALLTDRRLTRRLIRNLRGD